jgi:hypothetical protein
LSTRLGYRYGADPANDEHIHFSIGGLMGGLISGGLECRHANAIGNSLPLDNYLQKISIDHWSQKSHI